jgi:hypothetical protein
MILFIELLLPLNISNHIVQIRMVTAFLPFARERNWFNTGKCILAADRFWFAIKRRSSGTDGSFFANNGRSFCRLLRFSCRL